MTISYKKELGGQRVIVFANANTGTIVVQGNSSVSNLTSNASEEVFSAVLTQVYYGTPDGAHWELWRDTELVGVYRGTGHISYPAGGMLLDQGATGNVVANLVGKTIGSILFELKKN